MTLLISNSTEETKELYAAATRARNNSYSPYSSCKVGAAIKTATGKIYSGCNVENASYGGSICAERSAVVQAVSDGGSLRIDKVLVVTDATPAWPPCGICRQVLAEFANQQTTICLANLRGEYQQTKLQDIFPNAFTADCLPRPQ